MNVGLYIRVSTQEQADSGYSLEEQKERLQKYCEAMRWNIYKIYTDGGFSGGNTERPGLARLIKDVESGKLEKVIVYKLDRLSRSQKDTLHLIEDIFLANDCDFVSISENFDTATPFGRAMIGILAVFAQLEREQIKERMIMGKDARVKSGRYCGGAITPIGYDYIDGKTIINETERIQIVELFDLFLAGKNHTQIANILNDKGYRHHGNRMWIAKNVLDALGRITYTGKIKWKGEIYQGDHEPIISDETFEKAQNLLKTQCEQYVVKKRKSHKATTYLGGLLVCKQCGAKYFKSIGSHNLKSGYHVLNYYKCKNRHNVPYGKEPCKNKIWRVADLDEIILNEVRKLSIEHDNLFTEKKENIIPVLQNEIEKLNARIDKLMDLYTFGDISADRLHRKIADLESQKEKLEKEIEAESEKISFNDVENIVTSIDDILQGDTADIRAALNDLIDFIELDNDDITIHWNFM